MYARGCRCVARAGERKTGGRRNGDIYETRRHFIDLPGDAPVLYNARPSPARARFHRRRREIGFRGIEPRGGKRRGSPSRDKTLVCQVL